MINKRIHVNFNRPDKAVVEAFRGIPVANIADEMNRMGCLDCQIRPFNDRPLLGVALTVRSIANDNLLFHKAIQISQPGDVIVVDAEGSCAHSLCGEMMYSMAKGRGVDGFVIDGAIRDVASLRDMDFSVYARGVQPRGPLKNGSGEVNVAVSVGGIVVNPGDIIIGDADGVLVVRPEDAPEIISAARRKMKAEQVELARILSGDTRAPWLEAKLQEMGFEEID